MEMEKDKEELEMGLGLTLNCGGFVANKYVSGSKRPADFPPHHSSSKLGSQIVGWPPIRTYRMNSLVNQTKISDNEADKAVGENDQCKVTSENKGQKSNKNDAAIREEGVLGFGYVKVNMDGMQIGRKVDLHSHTSYQTLAQALEDMFLRPLSTSINSICGKNQKPKLPSMLLDGSSEFVLTYEDKEGDSMLVGDVPWRMFLDTVKRLRIMKTSEVGGLERNTTEKGKKPI